MNTLSIFRDKKSDKQTQGVLIVLGEHREKLFECFTLELPWRNNERQISCIPAGKYQIEHRRSQRFGHHIHILGVPNRSLILIHQANYVRQLQGCIAVGQKRLDLDGDGQEDVTNSVAMMKKLMDLIPEKSWLVIS